MSRQNNLNFVESSENLEDSLLGPPQVPLTNPDDLNDLENVKSFKQTGWRWVILLLISLYNLSNLYGQQIPAPIQTQLQNQLDISATQYNGIFTGFAAPNIILPIAAGMAALKFGLKKSIFGYTVLIIVGQFIQWIGVVQKSYAILMVGVVVFGIGSNGGVVLMNTFTANWFFGSELSAALAVGNAIQYAGQMVASVLMPGLYNEQKESVNFGFFYSFIQMIALCLIPFIFMVIIDRKADDYDEKNDIHINLQDQIHHEDEEEVSFRTLKHVVHFGSLFWYLQIATVFAYIGLCYNNNINDLLQNNYQLTDDQAGDYAAMQFAVQLPLTPLIGYITDKYGKRSLMMFIGGIFNIGQFIVFQMVPYCDSGPKCNPAYYIIPLVMGGIGNSFFGAVFQPMAALSVERKYCEIAFGVLDGMTQLGNSIGPLSLGPILDKTKAKNGFLWFFYYNIIIATFQLLFSAIIWITDAKGKNIFDQNQNTLQAKISKISQAISKQNKSFKESIKQHQDDDIY